MSWVSGRDWANAATSQMRELGEAEKYTKDLVRQHDARRAEVAQQAAHALSELTATLLPSLGREDVKRAVDITGYSPLLAQNPIEAMNAEAHDLTARLGKIESDTLFIHREHLRDPRGGKLILEQHELEAAQRSLEPIIHASMHPRLPHLLESGYGTPAYKVPFWRLSYYTDWEAADAILVNVPGKDFAGFREEYLRASEALRSLNDRLMEIQNQLKRGARLDHDHARLTQALATIPERTIAKAREALGRHVVDSGASALGTRFAAAPEVDILGKRVFGLAAKLAYMDGIRQAELLPMQADIQEGVNRAQRDIEKFSRPKKAMMSIPVANYQKRFRPVRERYQKRWHRYQRASDSVYVFDRYDRGSWATDFLWWDVMTDGKLDGDFIPEVQRFHQANPNYQYERSDYRDDAADVHYAEPSGFTASAFVDAS